MTASKAGIWFAVAFGLVSVVINAVTPSKIERIWVPAALIHLVISLTVALS